MFGSTTRKPAGGPSSSPPTQLHAAVQLLASQVLTELGKDPNLKLPLAALAPVCRVSLIKVKDEQVLAALDIIEGMCRQLREARARDVVQIATA